MVRNSTQKRIVLRACWRGGHLAFEVTIFFFAVSVHVCMPKLACQHEPRATRCLGAGESKGPDNDTPRMPTPEAGTATLIRGEEKVSRCKRYEITSSSLFQDS